MADYDALWKETTARNGKFEQIGWRDLYTLKVGDRVVFNYDVMGDDGDIMEVVAMNMATTAILKNLASIGDTYKVGSNYEINARHSLKTSATTTYYKKL